MKKIPTTYKSNTIRHLTKTKIFVKDGNVVYNDETNKSEMYTYQYNIPYANISILSLGHGTSITEQAIKKLSETDTLIVFMSINYKISSIIYPNNNRNAKYIIPWFNKINNEKNRLDLAKKKC
jgi:CRISPR-associated protein Cas1